MSNDIWIMLDEADRVLEDEERRLAQCRARLRHPAYRDRPEALLERVAEILTAPEST